jgi:uncharacterized protein (TIGR02646 family)
MRYIAIGDNKPDDTWLLKANTLTSKLLAATTNAERFLLIDGNESVWKEIKQFLRDLNYGKCWYSESKDDNSYMHVDHFRPKKRAMGLDKKDYGGYWWLAFEWTNFRYCGSISNVNKSDKFAVERSKANNNLDPINDELHYFLDPLKLKDVQKLTFDEEGKAKALSNNKSDWDYKRADYTVKSLKLNDGGLLDARKKVWHDCASLINKIADLLKENQTIVSISREQEIEDKMKELEKFVQKDAEYSATAQSCCITSGFIWAMRITA